jgi:hypothetical protein
MFGVVALEFPLPRVVERKENKLKRELQRKQTGAAIPKRRSHTECPIPLVRIVSAMLRTLPPRGRNLRRPKTNRISFPLGPVRLSRGC